MEGEPPPLGARRKQHRTGIMITLLVSSISLSNIVTFSLIGNYRTYGFLGFIFWADLLCLVASYILLLPLVLSPSQLTAKPIPRQSLMFNSRSDEPVGPHDFTLSGEGGFPLIRL
jgi:hypothetical protein